MEKYKIEQVIKKLKKVNKDAGNDADYNIVSVVNNMELYNLLIDNLDTSNIRQQYMIYQLSATIQNSLKLFGVYPEKKKEADSEDNFTKIIGKIGNKDVEKR